VALELLSISRNVLEAGRKEDMERYTFAELDELD